MGRKIMSKNRKASHLYHIEESIEAGISLKGTEVKSIRQGKANIADSYAIIRDNEAYIVNMHISPYEQGNIYNVDPIRTRKLLLHKQEILKLYQKTQIKGKTLVPLNLYLKNGKVKVEIGVAEGKKLYDRREEIAKKDAERRIRQHSTEKYNY